MPTCQATMFKQPTIVFQIYVIDSADRKRFEETGQVFQLLFLLRILLDTFQQCSINLFLLRQYVESLPTTNVCACVLFCTCYRSWPSCWMRRSWMAFPCWSSPTSRTCWPPPRRRRSPRASTCTPSGTACGRSSPARPSLGRGSRWVPLCPTRQTHRNVPF